MMVALEKGGLRLKIWPFLLVSMLDFWGVIRVYELYTVYTSGQIIATSHDLGPQNVAEEGNPFISGKSRLVTY